jgi:hypothetical protein
VIVQGPLAKGQVTDQQFAPDEDKLYEILVTVDLATGKVTMAAAGTTVTATLDKRPQRISWVGYAVLNAAADFSPVEALHRD